MISKLDEAISLVYNLQNALDSLELEAKHAGAGAIESGARQLYMTLSGNNMMSRLQAMKSLCEDRYGFYDLPEEDRQRYLDKNNGSEGAAKLDYERTVENHGLTNSRKLIKSSFNKTIFSETPNDCKNKGVTDIYFTVNGQSLRFIFEQDGDWDKSYLMFNDTGAIIEIPEDDEDKDLYVVLEDLFEPFEYDDIILTDVYGRYEITNSRKLIKSGVYKNDYSLNKIFR